MTKVYIAVGGAIATAIISVGFGIASWYESHKTTKKIGSTIKEVQDLASKDISEKIIKEAVNNAARSKVDHEIESNNSAILENAKIELQKRAKQSVNEQWEEVSKGVSEEISKQVADIDNDDLKRKVKNRAEDILVNKYSRELNDVLDSAKRKTDDKVEDFKNDLDRLVDKYGDNLSSMKKIYDSIGDALGGKKNDPGLHFSIG